ncbi:hypothetical protein [Rhizobium acaciae]|uniref:hypothetical protein n=1 Tax=Rhizobium acaciae TaxID=2989736 RepID=UPI00221E8E03|nr:hypothetical protein [Rhizobium acaciae]MCW1755038.1 hypothetical protein [Rhizobium acaciae]
MDIDEKLLTPRSGKTLAAQKIISTSLLPMCERNIAHGFRFATVAYPWHPLFGSEVRVSPYRRGKSLMSIYTDKRPDLSHELPNWMFDESSAAV